MTGNVFLAYPTMCDGCPYVNMEIFLKWNHCDECKKKKEFDRHRKLRYK